MKKRKFTALVLSAALFLTGAAFAEDDGYRRFETITNYAANLFIDESVTQSDIMINALQSVLKDNPELTNQLIKAGFEGLDDYSEFYTAEEYELFKKNLNHIVYGIGVVIQQKGDYVTIMSVLDGRAKAVGIMEGDMIAKVNGIDVKGETVDKVQDLVVGENGTEVTITFIRGEREFEETIGRGEVKGTTVAHSVLEGNIGYIRVVSFSIDTDKEFLNALEELDKENVTNIIIDLRDNPGGYMDAAVNIASLLVPKGVIVSAVYRNEWENETYYSELEKPKYKLAVLVNENTASASEILSSAIQDSGVGILIGDNTYGKGVIQQMYDIWDGCAFKITTGKYFTRNGKDINGGGLRPDEFVDNITREIDRSKYTPFSYNEKPAVTQSSDIVMATKERLKTLGYYYGEIDEYFDYALEKAVITFQAEHDLFPYGVIDISTQASIENAIIEARELADRQLIFAYEYFGGKAEDLEKE